MKISYKKVAKILIVLGIAIFLITSIWGFVSSCNLWTTDKSHSGVSMFEFALERLSNEWKITYILASIPASIGVVMLIVNHKSKG